jgi:hypothetical protein
MGPKDVDDRSGVLLERDEDGRRVGGSAVGRILPAIFFWIRNMAMTNLSLSNFPDLS